MMVHRTRWNPTIWFLAALIAIAGLASPLAAATTGSSAPTQMIKAKGHVQGISAADRKINIDGVVYDLAPDLVVRDDQGAVMEKYPFSYFSFVDEVEYTSLGNVIKEIKILKLTS